MTAGEGKIIADCLNVDTVYSTVWGCTVYEGAVVEVGSDVNDIDVGDTVRFPSDKATSISDITGGRRFVVDAGDILQFEKDV